MNSLYDIMNMEDPEERAMRILRNSSLPRYIAPLGPNKRHSYRLLRGGKVEKYVVYGTKADCDEDFEKYKKWIKSLDGNVK